MSLRPSVNQLRSLGNFTQMFRWAIRVPKVPELLQGAWSGIEKEFNARAMSATVPEKTGTSAEIQIRGNKVRQPGIVEYTSPWTCIVYETNDVIIQNFLRDWHNLYWDTNRGTPTGGSSSGVSRFKSELEGIIQLIQLNNLDQPIYEYNLIGAYIETYSRGDMDGSTAEPMQPNISIAYDFFTERSRNDHSANAKPHWFNDQIE